MLGEKGVLSTPAGQVVSVQPPHWDSLVLGSSNCGCIGPCGSIRILTHDTHNTTNNR